MEECKATRSDPNEVGRARNDRICWWLKRIELLSLGVAVGGIPLTTYNTRGIGPTVVFAGFVVFLMCRDARARLAVQN